MRAACFGGGGRASAARARPEGRGRFARRRGGPAANARARHVETDEDDPKRTNRDDRPVGAAGRDARSTRRARDGRHRVRAGGPRPALHIPPPPRARPPNSRSSTTASLGGVRVRRHPERGGAAGQRRARWEAEFNRTLRKASSRRARRRRPGLAYEALRRAAAANANAGALPGTSSLRGRGRAPPPPRVPRRPPYSAHRPSTPPPTRERRWREHEKARDGPRS